MSHLRHIIAGAAVLVSSLAISQSASAQWYTDRAAWQAAVTGQHTTVLDGLVSPGGYASYNTPAGLSISGLNFVGNPLGGGSALYVQDAAFYPMYFDWGSGAVMTGIPGSITVSFLNPAFRAFGFDFFGINPEAMTYAFQGNFNVDGHSISANSAATKTRNFLGYVGSTPLSTLTYSTPDASIYLQLDNFSTATGRSFPDPIVSSAASNVVPEPGSVFLVATGLLGIYFVGRKRRTAA